MKKQILFIFYMLCWLLILSITFTFSAKAAQKEKISNKPEFEYIVSPNKVDTGEEVTINFCMINHGAEGIFTVQKEYLVVLMGIISRFHFQ